MKNVENHIDVHIIKEKQHDIGGFVRHNFQIPKPKIISTNITNHIKIQTLIKITYQRKCIN